ncbi:hypothetical protein [Encephalitozoon cuniculi GB-M1]|uniref:Uncharacterized protein n=1 Tax=Encephalitozoon cuniculi (strain GB-M1) TaxID=284813 RepID=Q8SU13_ENCCU|nr:uncharacterized protein ECU11_1630 [Encephalitozoon cuniculi GB-M1]CAD26073.1 hypothetical protein [Encephalitozoon cuniculi GB-M1]
MVPSYFISTRSCVVPHVVDAQSVPSTNKNIKIYADDILYKDSPYDEGFDLSLKDFCAISGIKTCLGFRNKPSILVSKKGHYKLKAQRYKELLEVLRPDYYADFKTGKITVERDELIEPKDVRDLVEWLSKGHLLFGTEFINDLVSQGTMLKLSGCRLEVCGIFDCKCCGSLSPGYLEYLWSIKEMSAFTYLAIHNYNTLDRMFEALGRGELCPGEIEIGS